MAENLGELIVSISADISKLQKGLTEAQKATKQTEDVTGKSTALIAGMWIAAGAAIVGALGAMVKSGVEYGDEIFEVSQRTGIATETLSKLKYVAEQTESSFEAVSTGLRFLSRNINSVNEGNLKLNLAFADLGVNVKDSNGHLKNTEDIFLEVADGFTHLESDAKKTALAMEIFGRGGASLVPVLNLGREGILNLSKEAEKLGLVLTADNAKKIDEYSDNIKKMKAAFGGLSLELTNAVVPALSKFTEWITEGLIKLKEFNAAGGLLGKRGQSLTDANLQGGDPALLGGTPNPPPEIELQKITIVADAQKQAHAEEMARQDEMSNRRLQQVQDIKSFAESLHGLSANIQGAFSTALSSLILNGGKAIDIAKALGAALIKAVVDWVAEQIIAATIGKALKAAELLITTAFAHAIGAAWIGPATLATIATLGGAAAQAPGAIAASMAASSGLAGFAEGTDTVPAMLTPGEMIIPRSFSEAIKSGDLTLGGRQSGNASAGNSPTINIELNAIIHETLDIQKVAQEIAYQTSRELRYVR